MAAHPVPRNRRYQLADRRLRPDRPRDGGAGWAVAWFDVSDDDSVVAFTLLGYYDGAGHEKHDGAQVVRRRPDYILIGNVDITDGPRNGLIPPLDREVDIVLNQDFQRAYELFSLPVGDGKYLNMFRRRDLRR